MLYGVHGLRSRESWHLSPTSPPVGAAVRRDDALLQSTPVSVPQFDNVQACQPFCGSHCGRCSGPCFGQGLAPSVACWSPRQRALTLLLAARAFVHTYCWKKLHCSAPCSHRNKRRESFPVLTRGNKYCQLFKREILHEFDPRFTMIRPELAAKIVRNEM